MNVQPDDIKIMQLIATRDQQALHSLYQRYGTAVYSLAYRVLQNVTLAEEVTQDTFLKIWEHKAEWDPEKGKLKSWLLSITHFTAVDRVRQERRQPSLHPASIEDMEDEVHMGGEGYWQDGTVLRMLMSQLSQEQIRLLEMAFFQGMSHSEIANVTQLPLGTVKTRLRGGLQRLRQLWLETAERTSAFP